MKRIHRWMMLVLVAIPCAASISYAQASDSSPKINMDIGAPVRVVARDSSRVLVGTFSWQAGDSLVLHRGMGASDTTVLLRNLLRIEEQVRPFSTPATRRGAAVGAVAGLVAGVLIAQKARHDCDPSAPPTKPSPCDVTYSNVLQYTLVGAASIGWGIAWLTDERRWQVRWSAPLP